MNSFLDSSVLIATFYAQHEHHEASIQLFLKQTKRTACVAAHSLAEVYSVLTGMPGKNRVSPDEALLFLSDVLQRFTVVALEEGDYQKAVESAAAIGIAGGGIYDFLVGCAARRARAKRIYTWNVKHFSRLGPEMAGQVTTPED